MLNWINKQPVWQRYREEEKGNVTLVFALCSVVAIGVMGAALDFSTLSSAEARSQSIADQTALAAAIYVKNHNAAPEEGDDGIVAGTYSAKRLGYDFEGWVDGGAENVDIEIVYDEVALEARVKVTGQTIPTFMQVFGKERLGFEANSTAKFSEVEFYDPATVVMVLDNSGSMAFDDKPLIYDHSDNSWDDQEGAQPRIQALRTQATKFMDELHGIVGDQTKDDDKILRTGMLAYNTQTITARTVLPDWKVDPTKASVGNMVASGGTNSAPPLDTARIWMEGEDKIHKDIHGDDPLKFLIFMTDGVNSDDYGVTWVEEEGTGQWRGYVLECKTRRRSGTYCWYDEDTVESEDRPNYGYNWEEGKWALNADLYSDADCTSMKNDGVRIYSIGFGLAEGTYETNGYFGDNRTYTIGDDVRTQAYTLLSGCASEPATFLTAENTDELEEAFEKIGRDIQTEIIRLSN